MTTPAPIPGTPALADPSTNIASTSFESKWTAASDAADYVVYRKVAGSDAWTAVATVTGTAYTHSGLDNVTTYNTHVKARNVDLVEGAASNIVTTTTLRQVRFSHPWTDPHTNISYEPGQLADFSEDLAKRLVYNGIARYTAGPADILINPGPVDDVELGVALARYEKKVSRDGANPGYVVTLGSDGQTLILSAAASGGGTGGSTVSGATATAQGTVKLAGDLSGTADNPTVPGLASRLTLEQVQDAVGAMLIAGAGMAVAYDDPAGTVTLTATGSGGATDQEVVRDTVAAALRAGANVTIVHDDLADTITIAAATDPEVVRDTVGAALVAGANISIVVDDVANTITLASTGGGATDPEVVRDTIAVALRAGGNISVVVDDLADTITLTVPSATPTAQGAVRLAGDLEGTADLPTVVGLAGKYDYPAGGIPKTHMTTAVQSSLTKADGSVQTTQVGVASGVASLGADGLIPLAQLPSSASGPFYLGSPANPVRDPAAPRPALPAGVSCWWDTPREPDNWLDGDYQVEAG